MTEPNHDLCIQHFGSEHFAPITIWIRCLILNSLESKLNANNDVGGDRPSPIIQRIEAGKKYVASKEGKGMTFLDHNPKTRWHDMI